MKMLLKFVSFSFLLVLIFGCSGSKKAAVGDAAGYENAQVRAKIEQLQEKIAEQPNNLEYRRQLAAVHNENGNSLDAMKTLEEALTFDPNDAETKFMYAETAIGAGYKAKGYQTYKDILQGVNGNDYLSRIAPMFSDVFQASRITSSPAQEAFAGFTGDGTKIVYQSDANGSWDIFEYELASESVKQITNSTAHEENPYYSKDGAQILYTSTEEDHREVEYERKLRDIFVMDMSNNRTLNLTTNGADDWHPAYSSDGKHIAFVSDRSDMREVLFYERYSDVFIMEKDGRFQLQLTDTLANDGSPCIAPGSTEDNGIIYFDSDRSGHKAIYMMDFKGDNLRQITFNPQADDAGPMVSANGDKIAFFSNRDGNYELYMMNADGSAQQRVTSNPADDLNPVFSPDGRKILFHSNRSGNYDVYLMDLSEQTGSVSMSDIISNIDAAIKAAE